MLLAHIGGGIARLALCAAVAVCLWTASSGTGLAQDVRPNIVLIVADDAGYADFGSFGSEIRTPNIDALASVGVRFTQFAVSATCSPSRSMLLSGTDSHIAGLGNMAEFTAANQKGKPGYEGFLTDRVATVASILKDAGYKTYMAGKWHMGEEPEHWPAARGFTRDLTLIPGGGSHFDDMWARRASGSSIRKMERSSRRFVMGFIRVKIIHRQSSTTLKRTAGMANHSLHISHFRLLTTPSSSLLNGWINTKAATIRAMTLPARLV
ncbi:MAG: sulfatase-like hydrolase/transferase [Rhizobiales bacterium]|nr:sulfatase-like hydrolase/transferase [Hyphomicrobiales bacterium]